MKIFGVIETKRKKNVITILFDVETKEYIDPDEDEGKDILFLRKIKDSNYYRIRINKITIGSLKVKAIINNFSGRQKFRLIGDYILNNRKYNKYIEVGARIVFPVKRKKIIRDFGERQTFESISYRKTIRTKTDNREMVFIPEGKFVFGSNSGDRDEYPRQIKYTTSYYIDKYEVSNGDYKRYMDFSGADIPVSWKDKKVNEAFLNLPVLVTYKEAKDYAEWAGKRLPTEVEWEKAARGLSKAGIIYPWGNKFDPSRVNSVEFWAKKNIAADIKNKFDRGLLPVFSFNNNGISPMGVVNMAGNAMEWTSSWYMPYRKNKRKNRFFGTQYKVIRGGAWFSNWYKVRTTNREIGGAPNLYRDSFAGFRCVKKVTFLDLDYEIE